MDHPNFNNCTMTSDTKRRTAYDFNLHSCLPVNSSQPSKEQFNTNIRLTANIFKFLKGLYNLWRRNVPLLSVIYVRIIISKRDDYNDQYLVRGKERLKGVLIFHYTN